MEGVRRPEAVILSPESIVPEKNLISPAPDQFTHRVTRPQPYYFAKAASTADPDGEFPAGTPVVLLAHDGGPYCRVADGQGLYVETAFDGLEKA